VQRSNLRGRTATIFRRYERWWIPGRSFAASTRALPEESSGFLSPAGVAQDGPRKLSFTEQELGVLADAFAEYAAEQIVDIVGLRLDSALFREVQLEVVHAIRSVIEDLPDAMLSPALQFAACRAGNAHGPKE
jgi:hypothetical protein